MIFTVPLLQAPQNINKCSASPLPCWPAEALGLSLGRPDGQRRTTFDSADITLEIAANSIKSTLQYGRVQSLLRLCGF
jgi:hypothetical protein